MRVLGRFGTRGIAVIGGAVILRVPIKLRVISLVVCLGLGIVVCRGINLTVAFGFALTTDRGVCAAIENNFGICLLRCRWRVARFPISILDCWRPMIFFEMPICTFPVLTSVI